MKSNSEWKFKVVRLVLYAVIFLITVPVAIASQSDEVNNPSKHDEDSRPPVKSTTDEEDVLQTPAALCEEKPSLAIKEASGNQGDQHSTVPRPPDIVVIDPPALSVSNVTVENLSAISFDGVQPLKSDLGPPEKHAKGRSRSAQYEVVSFQSIDSPSAPLPEAQPLSQSVPEESPSPVPLPKDWPFISNGTVILPQNNEGYDNRTTDSLLYARQFDLEKLEVNLLIYVDNNYGRAVASRYTFGGKALFKKMPKEVLK